MSKQSKDQEVLIAILNVKKYATNLKKKASNLLDPSDEQDADLAGSSPSFFDQRQQNEYLELNSPLLATKSSYNESFESMARKKKQHSMTYLPGPKKADRQLRKNSDFFASEPLSPAKTYTHALGRTNLSQSYKMEGTGMKSNKQRIWKKQLKQPDLKLSTLEKNTSENKDKEADSHRQSHFQQFNQTMPAIKSTQKSNGNTKQDEGKFLNAKLFQQLVKEINSLKNQICNYKKSLILFRNKYLQMEQRCRAKVFTDHLLDIYQQKICGLENERERLTQTIKSQNEKIANFQFVVVQIAKRFSVHFAEQTHKALLLKIQNQVYRDLLNLKLPTDEALKPSVVIENVAENQDKKAQQISKDYQVFSESEQELSELGENWKSNPSFICKNQKDIKIKYDLLRNFIE